MATVYNLLPFFFLFSPESREGLTDYGTEVREITMATKVNLTTKEAAERLGVSVQTTANWRCAGVGPDYLKINNGRVMYSLAAIEDYERRCLIKAIA